MIDIIRKSQMEVTQTAPTMIKYSVAVWRWRLVAYNFDIMFGEYPIDLNFVAVLFTMEIFFDTG